TPVVEVHGRRESRRRRAVRGLDLPDANQLVGVRKRERLEEHAIHDAENRAVRADAERERQNGDRGERRIFRQRPQRETDVAAQFTDSFAELGRSSVRHARSGVASHYWTLVRHAHAPGAFTSKSDLLALRRQQATLAVLAPLVTRNRSVGANHAVAWD